MAPFSSILRHANAAKHPHSGPATEQEEVTGPLRLGRVKSFSQKSGWGFIQLFESSGETLETSRDVFFHRADVARSGPVELRPGMIVHCRVVSTGKGEKASGIAVVETEEEDGLSSAESNGTSTGATPPATPLNTHVLDDQISIPGDLDLAAMPPNHMPTSAYSLMGTSHRISWTCTTCSMKNCIPGRLRVMVVCAGCRHVHAVQQWACRCGHLNKRESRQCTLCDGLYAMSCLELHVQLAEEAVPSQPEDSSPIAAAPIKRMQTRRSRWSHGSQGWSHPNIDAPNESTWCQDATAGVKETAKCVANVPPEAALFAGCHERLIWARDWLLDGRPASPEDGTISKEWLYRFSEEICAPQHCLLCPARGCMAFVPNPCADVTNASVLRMYETLGVVLALAILLRIPLHPVMPMWMARSLLGHPTSMEDLNEFDPALFQKVDLLMKHTNVDALNLPFAEEISRYGVTRTFISPHGLQVTQANRHLYGLWLKDVYLNSSIEVQMKHIQRGFLATILGTQLCHGLTPEDISNTINGERVLDVAALRASLKVCQTLHALPAMEGWLLHAVMYLSARQWQLLLRFVTGLGKVPYDHLDSSEKSVTICHDPRLPHNSLPIANRHACQLILPAYNSPEMLQQMLMAALGNQPQGFAGYSKLMTPPAQAPLCGRY